MSTSSLQQGYLPFNFPHLFLYKESYKELPLELPQSMPHRFLISAIISMQLLQYTWISIFSGLSYYFQIEYVKIDLETTPRVEEKNFFKRKKLI